MKKQLSNVASVVHHTVSSTKAARMQNFDLSSALQTTLEFDQLISIFSSKMQDLIPHSGYIYRNQDLDINIEMGIVSKHSCNYSLKIEEQPLGELKLMRSQRFTKGEINQLESLLCSIVYPLKNATLYHNALKLAHTDPLTKTFNRATFAETLERECSLAKRHETNLSVLFLDIDHFKYINDQYGHDFGDSVLSSVAQWIKECVRCSDMIFRYGGEEFVILLNGTHLEGAKLLAERIRETIERHTLVYDMDTVKVTASIGVASYQNQETGETLIKRADKAVYQAKKQGRNQFVVSE